MSFQPISSAPRTSEHTTALTWASDDPVSSFNTTEPAQRTCPLPNTKSLSLLLLLNFISCFWSRSKLMIVELDPESGSALMEKLDPWLSTWDTVTLSFGVGVGRLADDDVIHTAIEV